MTTFKCPTCSSHWQEGSTRDMREDVTCRKCLEGELAETYGHLRTKLNEVETLERERDELVEALRDFSFVSSGPCQSSLQDRCRCMRCFNQRRDALLAKHPLPKANG